MLCLSECMSKHSVLSVMLVIQHEVISDFLCVTNVYFLYYNMQHLLNIWNQRFVLAACLFINMFCFCFLYKAVIKSLMHLKFWYQKIWKYDNKLWLALRAHCFLGFDPFKIWIFFLNNLYYTWYLFPFFFVYIFKLKTTIRSPWYNKIHTTDLLCVGLNFTFCLCFCPMENK